MRLFILLLWLSGLVFADDFEAENNFIKVSSQGVLLPSSAKDWSCVLDNKTALMWEVKSSRVGLQFLNNHYTWFDGNTGTENGKHSKACHWGALCNTKAYVLAINELALCGYKNWRLPTFDELQGLKRYPDTEPTINQFYFPHSQADLYWSSSEEDEDSALDVAFFYGGIAGSGKEFESLVRAVRDVDASD